MPLRQALHACHALKPRLRVQVNGGTTAEKVDFASDLFEQSVSVDTVIAQNDMIDTIAITKGRGTEGVVTRWGVTRLPRKTHRGLRKVCVSVADEETLLTVFRNGAAQRKHGSGCANASINGSTAGGISQGVACFPLKAHNRPAQAALSCKNDSQQPWSELKLLTEPCTAC